MMSKTIQHRISLLIFALTFLLYGNSIRNNYAFDDDYVAVTKPGQPNNPKIAKGFKGIPEIFTTHYIESKQQSFEYRPLVLATFAIEYQFFGSNPHISHLINILLYAITCNLLFLVFIRVFKHYDPVFSLLAVLLFLIHPIHTEVVSNIKSRDELLAFLFGLCSLYYVLLHIESGKASRLLLAVIFLYLAQLCKVTSTLFIVFIPLTLYFFTTAPLKKIAWVIAALAAAMVIQKVSKSFLLADSNVVRAYAFFENPLYYGHGFMNRLVAGFATTGYYLRLLLLPYPLCCYYGYDVVPVAGHVSPPIIISSLVHLAALAYVIKNFRQKSALSYAIIIYLVGMAPFANVVALVTGIIGERLIYAASLGFCLALAWLLALLFKVDVNKRAVFNVRALKKPFVALVVLLCLAGGSMVLARNKAWKDELSILRNDSRQFDQSCNLHYILGNKLYPSIFNTPAGPVKDSIIREATFHYRRAAILMTEGVKKYPGDYTTLNNIGTIYVNIFNDAAAAQPFFRAALAGNPSDEVTQYNFAYCYEKRQMPDSAIAAYEAMLAKHTLYAPVYLQLRVLYVQKKRYPGAIACDEALLRQTPASAELHIDLGNDYLLNGDTLNGVKQFEAAVELEPANTGLRTQIVAFLRSAGFSREALSLEKK